MIEGYSQMPSIDVEDNRRIEYPKCGSTLVYKVPALHHLGAAAVLVILQSGGSNRRYSSDYGA